MSQVVYRQSICSSRQWSCIGTNLEERLSNLDELQRIWEAAALHLSFHLRCRSLLLHLRRPCRFSLQPETHCFDPHGAAGCARLEALGAWSVVKGKRKVMIHSLFFSSSWRDGIRKTAYWFAAWEGFEVVL
jgi:hypothetical protein